MFLPVVHPEFNPIEKVCGRVKRAVSSRNMKLQLREVEEGTKRQINLVTAFDFPKYENPSCREEEKYKQSSVAGSEAKS